MLAASSMAVGIITSAQAVEAKEGATIRPPNAIRAFITYALFFSYYSKVAGMTVRDGGQGIDLLWVCVDKQTHNNIQQHTTQGTATTEEPEFLEAYNLSVVQVYPFCSAANKNPMPSYVCAVCSVVAALDLNSLITSQCPVDS